MGRGKQGLGGDTMQDRAWESSIRKAELSCPRVLSWQGWALVLLVGSLLLSVLSRGARCPGS